MLVNKTYAVTRKSCNFVVVKQIIIPCILQNCRNIRSDKTFSVSYAYDKRTLPAHSKNFIGKILEHNSKRKRTLKLGKNAVNSFKRVSVVFIIKKLSNNLSICFTQKCSSLSNKKFFKLYVILNNTVVNNGYSCTAVRMRINIRRLAVCSPSCMTYTDVTFGFTDLFQLIFQVFKLSLRLNGFNFIVFKNSYSG